MGAVAPTSICCMGGKFAVDDDRTIPDTAQTIFQFPEGWLDIFGMYEASGYPTTARSGFVELRGTQGVLFANDQAVDIVPERGGQFQDSGCSHGMANEAFRVVLKEIPENKQWIPYEDVEMKPAFWGGVELNETFGWFLTQEVTYANNTIVLRVLKFPPPKNLDSVAMAASIPAFSQLYRTRILPEIINE